MGSNTLFHSSIGLLVVTHLAAALCLWYGPRSPTFLLSLNTLVASIVVAYAASRLRYILAGFDRRFMAFFLVELLILICAICALKGNGPALKFSYVAFVVHSIMVLGAVVFAFTFKMRLF